MKATKVALGELGMTVNKEEADDATGLIKTRAADGSKVTIKYRREVSQIPTEGTITEICVRVGAFGDHPLSGRDPVPDQRSPDSRGAAGIGAAGHGDHLAGPDAAARAPAFRRPGWRPSLRWRRPAAPRRRQVPSRRRAGLPCRRANRRFPGNKMEWSSRAPSLRDWSIRARNHVSVTSPLRSNQASSPTKLKRYCPSFNHPSTNSSRPGRCDWCWPSKHSAHQLNG